MRAMTLVTKLLIMIGEDNMVKELNEDLIIKLMNWIVNLEKENLNSIEDEYKWDIATKIYKKIEEELNCYCDQ